MIESPQQLISKVLQSRQIDDFGWARLEKPFSFELYEAWLNEKRHGDMFYLEKQAPLKKDPREWWPQARSAIVVTLHYHPTPQPAETPLKASRVALYARNEDYHDWFQKRLEELCQELRALFPTEHFLAATDSFPVLERDLAARAGLGWVGKNTCLIHEKKGSFFFINFKTKCVQVIGIKTPKVCDSLE